MVEPITRERLQMVLASGEIQLVDVLPEAEFRAAHIPGAINIPLKSLDGYTTDFLRRDKPVAVY